MSKKIYLVILYFLFVIPSKTLAQQVIIPNLEEDNFEDNNVENIQEDWRIAPSFEVYYRPDYLGARSYSLQMLPDIQVDYKNKFSASIFEGAWYNLIQQNNWRAGPIAKIRFARQQSEGTVGIRINNHNTKDLQGMGSVSSVLESGIFVEYSIHNFINKLELRQGVGKVGGKIAEFSFNYSKEYKDFEILIGPFFSFVDRKYNNTYFGINAMQSHAAELTQYGAKGGLLSRGFEFEISKDLNDEIDATFFLRAERLGSQAAKSPLIKQRGAANQFMFGIYFSYSL